jgi:hypothetical protein
MISRSGRKRAFLLAAALAFLLLAQSGDLLCRAARLNLAHVMLLRWASQPPGLGSERSLIRSVGWGTRAGADWERHGHGERAAVLLARLQSDGWRERERALSAYRQGQRLEREGETTQALAHYREASNWVGSRVASIYAIYRLLQQGGDSVRVEAQLDALVALTPDFRAALAITDHVRLLGCDLDPWSLEGSEGRIPVVFYWEVPASDGTPREWVEDGWRYIRVRTRLYQIGMIDNLLPNGGFEQDLSTRVALPLGYRNLRDARIRGEDGFEAFLKSHHRLVTDQRDGHITQVAAAVNPRDETDGMATAHKVPVQEGALYLFGGWMRVTDTNEGYLAGVWWNGGDELLYWKVAKWVSVQSWHHFVAASVAPEGADSFSPLALNRGVGEAWFDDLILLQVPLPMEMEKV